MCSRCNLVRSQRDIPPSIHITGISIYLNGLLISGAGCGLSVHDSHRPKVQSYLHATFDVISVYVSLKEACRSMTATD